MIAPLGNGATHEGRMGTNGSQNLVGVGYVMQLGTGSTVAARG